MQSQTFPTVLKVSLDLVVTLSNLLAHPILTKESSTKERGRNY